MNREESRNFYLTRGKTAILIDGGFFLKRLGTFSKEEDRWNVDYIFEMLQKLCSEHAARLDQQIYRVFYYDCPPYDRGLHNPITNRYINYKKIPLYTFKMALFEKLRNMRKLALRLGRISLEVSGSWQIKPEKVNDLLSGKITVADLDPEKDILPCFRQKQVDIKIGVDIASMALKHQVESIVLVAGDGDFVPASKLARREGIDFILDPMWAHVNNDLLEHVDGIQTVLFQHEEAKVEQEGNEQ